MPLPACAIERSHTAPAAEHHHARLHLPTTLSNALCAPATRNAVQVKGKGLMQTALWIPNSLRPELLQLDADHNPRTLRKVLTGGSFMSTRSRMTVGTYAVLHTAWLVRMAWRVPERRRRSCQCMCTAWTARCWWETKLCCTHCPHTCCVLCFACAGPFHVHAISPHERALGGESHLAC